MQSEQFQLHARLEERHWWFVARRQILGEVVRAVAPPGATVVDVGCGTGANLASLAAEYSCVGIDTSADAIRLAQARFPAVRFVCGLAPRDLGAALGAAGVVLLCDVLEHVRDDFALFSELLAATRPGTFLLVTVPAELALWSEHDRAFGHFRRYDAARLAQVWQGLPVRQVFLSPFNARLYPAVRAARAWNRLRGTSGGEAGTDFRLPAPAVNRALAGLFAGERHRLVRLAQGARILPYRRGVSLMGLVERTAGCVEPRHKPPTVAADAFDPIAACPAAV